MQMHTEPLHSNESVAGAWDVDWRTIIDDLGGDELLLEELIGVYLASLPETLDETRAAVARVDLPAVARAAHKLKGTVGNFGFGPAWKAARMLEETARAGNAAETTAAFEAAEQELAQLEERLKARTRTASA